ncbi:hypothetical protein VCRA2122O12_490002 [Vibrio crassostreae]|nr:hypothetical protein VCRA2114E5_420002 [Vibrio crassostreae]CAK2068144.1 hypothetical protein VCRA2110O1_460003 [Vibrio crassostreae]CAK2089739.1 hypothetical protein VCRA2110O4_500002 [Vibrio crassostreae]CAK2848163.1 hypothetical protein VCRA2110O3_470002 [Vibrio crassostreae]CAK2913319.1 hypothetical protein VCRA2110O2_500001 [Vibrio crassostreae]
MKVARWVLRETALGNKCRPPDHYWLDLLLIHTLFMGFYHTKIYSFFLCC